MHIGPFEDRLMQGLQVLLCAPNQILPGFFSSVVDLGTGWPR